MTGESHAGRAAGAGQAPTGRLVEGLTDVVTAAGERLLSAAGDRMSAATERLVEYAAHGGSPRLAAAATGARATAAGRSSGSVALRAGLAGAAAKVRRALGGGARSGKDTAKVTNIVESIDVGVPVRLAYNQWTQFADWPAYTKKVESVEQDGDEKLTWKAQIFWSHRTWESTIVEQVPDRRVVWRSTGVKGSVDGSVTFHELGPELTRILLVLEYHPQGLFERTGNIWRAQGRRARLELKHFARHVMTQSILRPTEIEGWRGEIRDGRVVKDHQAGLADERRERVEPSPPAARRRPPAGDRRARPTGRGRSSSRDGGSDRAGDPSDRGGER